MAELNENDFVSEGAIRRIKELNSGFEDATASLIKLINTGKELGVSIKGADNIKDVREETEKLTASQVELQKIEKQISTIQAKNNDEYIKATKALNDAKTAQKEKIALGEKDARAINAQNASLKELEAALKKNREAYRNLANEEARASKEGQQLKAIIDEQDKSVKEQNESLGIFNDSVGNYEKGLKGLKTELKQAKDDMANIAKTTGTGSLEFIKASEKAGQLKDEINDLNDAIKNTSASKFENIGTSLKDVGSKLLNLDFDGAAQSAKQFAAIVKSLTFAEIIAGLESFGKTLAVVGKAILTNPIFIIAGILAGVGLAFKFFIDQQEKASARAIERYKEEEEALLSRYDKEIKLQRIIGKQTFDLEKERQRIIIKSAEQQEEEITKRKQGIQELLKAGLNLAEANKFADEAEKILSDEKRKNLNELRKARRDAANEILIIEAEQAEFERRTSADTVKQRKDGLFELAKFRLQVEIDGNEEIANSEKSSYDDRIEAVKKFTILKNKLAKLEQTQALSQEKLTAEAITLINEQYTNAILSNNKNSAKEQQKITEETTKLARENALKELEEFKKALEKKIKAEMLAAEQEYLLRKSNLDKQTELIKNQAIEGKVTKEQAGKEIAALEKSLADDYIQLQIDKLTKILSIEGLTAEESATITKELYKLKGDLTNAYYNQVEASEKSSLQKTIDFIDASKQLYSDFASSVGGLLQGLSDARIKALDNESKAISDKLEKDLEAAGTNEAAKDKLRKKAAADEAVIEKKRREEKIKSAKIEKAFALVSATINFAGAVLKALNTVPPASFALAAITAALAGIQVAAIAATPIPAYEKGVKFKPTSGPALVGEKGVELLSMPNGQMALTPSYASIMDLPRGTEVVPHNETMRRLAMGALTRNGGTSQVHAMDPALLEEVKLLNHNIKNIKQPRIPDLVRQNATVYAAMKDSENHTKLVRSINLGKYI